jgi:hypothetical protein
MTDSEQAVRRLREESRLRVETQRRWRAFARWCVVATLAGGTSLAALDVRDTRLRAREAADLTAIAAHERARAEGEIAAARGRAAVRAPEDQRRCAALTAVFSRTRAENELALAGASGPEALAFFQAEAEARLAHFAEERAAMNCDTSGREPLPAQQGE